MLSLKTPGVSARIAAHLRVGVREVRDLLPRVGFDGPEEVLGRLRLRLPRHEEPHLLQLERLQIAQLPALHQLQGRRSEALPSLHSFKQRLSILSEKRMIERIYGEPAESQRLSTFINRERY